MYFNPPKALGPLMVCVTYGSLLLGEYCTVFVLIPSWCSEDASTLSVNGKISAVLYSLVFLYAITNHIRCMCSEPGYTPEIPIPYELPIDKIRYCEVCEQFKPDRTHHCRTCKKCIHKMDHHCPWVNNCIGACNQKFFILFLISGKLLCIMTLSCILFSVCWYFESTESVPVQVFSVLVTLVTLVVSTAYALFISTMLEEQLQCLIYNQSEIEGLNGLEGEDGAKKNLYRIMGPLWNWLNPCSAAPEQNYLEKTVKASDKKMVYFSVYYYSTTTLLASGILITVYTFSSGS